MFIRVKDQNIRADRIISYSYDEKGNTLWLNVDGVMVESGYNSSHSRISVSGFTIADYRKFEEELPAAIARAYAIIRGDDRNPQQQMSKGTWQGTVKAQ